ncbi:MAG: helix-turn-helix domain-containing protein [Halobacteria archaeon]
MPSIAAFKVEAQEFELGRLLRLIKGSNLGYHGLSVEPESGFSILLTQEKDREESEIERHEKVEKLTKVSEEPDTELFLLKYDVSSDELLQKLPETDSKVLSAEGDLDTWKFNVRFGDETDIDQFFEGARENDVEIQDVEYYSTEERVPENYDLTDRQLRSLRSAVEKGYFNIPREIDTSELAKEFDISDQAVVERLRRGIKSLTENTILKDS